MYPNCNNLSYEEIFAKNVKARREAMGLTRKELAENCMGYPEELLARVESGDTAGCTINFLVCLAEHLKVPLETLVCSRYFCPRFDMKTITKETYIDGKNQPILHDEDMWMGKYKTYGEMWTGEGYTIEQ